jgi:hypothetical protein
MPLKLPRADPWSWAATGLEKIVPNAKTVLITSHLIFIEPELLSSHLIY